MLEAIRVNDPALLDIIENEPRLADRLMDCMKIQPEIDPEAGFGAMHAFSMWLAMPFKGITDKLLDRVENDTYRFYLVLRAISLGYMSGDQVVDLILTGKQFNYHHMLGYVSGTCKLFRADLVSAHVTGSQTQCQSDSPSPRKSKKRASSTGCSRTRSKPSAKKSKRRSTSATTK